MKNNANIEIKKHEVFILVNYLIDNSWKNKHVSFNINLLFFLLFNYFLIL